MKRFIYLYLVMVPLLFLVLYWSGSPIAQWVNQYQTKMVLYVLGLGLMDGQLQGIDIMINPHYKIIITKACNGMIPYLIFLSSVLAYPSSWLYKFNWLVVGYVILFAINIIRLFIVIYFVTIDPDNFSISHDIAGNAILLSSGLALFYIFTDRAKNI